MSIVDRRIQKSQKAIKDAFVELMAEKGFDQITMQDLSERANVGRRTIYHHYMDKYDLLDKLIGEHLDELSTLCEATAELNYAEGTVIWFQYFERNYSFFSTMLASKGAPAFRSRFLAFVIEELKHEMDVTEGKNQGLHQNIILRFFGAAVVEIVESWFTSEIAEPAAVVAEQMGRLLDRNV
ncbi:TetR/AcrR family transcriptional regulator [Ectobacillus ponti]|uniref:TetR/AcrR family transcriptional regulator n=1 Tax=Ectobacillus ponti TaxID=2961894 RepID=A0AA42BRG1_9BACI|nr:TetR/AcrR family transcriptional regulator [Ectobacillus ponti]MCP8970902.1 TetR/AcrR family transcriptional regulator [Ectobacillus ponti]